jgi:hypothetical protein
MLSSAYTRALLVARSVFSKKKLLCLALVAVISTRQYFLSLTTRSHSIGRIERKSSSLNTTLSRFDDCNGNSTNRVAQSWCLDTNGKARYWDMGKHSIGTSSKHKWPKEKLYRTRLGYEQCLAKKSIVFMGDSRVRYQYMQLADFLRTGTWMACEDHLDLQPEDRCFLIDHEHKRIELKQKETKTTWNEWYQRSNEYLNVNGSESKYGSQQSELCDCHRTYPRNDRTTFENRFFRRQTPFGLIEITYLENFLNAVQFHADFPPFSPFEKTEGRCLPGNCTHQAGILDSNTTLWEILPSLNATHVFANAGWFDTPSFACDLQHYGATTGVEATFVTHFASQGNKDTIWPTLACNVSVLDRITPTTRIPSSWMFHDEIHGLSIVNEEVNHMLLDNICGEL